MGTRPLSEYPSAYIQPSLQGSPVAPTYAGFGATASAAFRLNNPIASYFADEGPDYQERSRVEPDFDFFKQVEIDGLGDYWRSGLGILNSDAYGKWKAQIEREIRDRETLASAGWTGTILSLGSAVLDPTVALPGGSIIRAAKGGYSTLKSGLSVGRAALGQASLAEAALQSSQQIRTGEETAFALGGSAVLGALLGAGAGRFLSRVERVEIANRLQSDIQKNIDAVDEQLQHEAALNQRIAAAGAEVTRQRTLEELTPAGRPAQILAKVGEFIRLNPATRAFTSPSAVERQFALRMFRNPAYLNMHLRGETLGPDLQTSVKKFVEGDAIDAVRSIRELYADFRKAGGKMPYEQFGREVTNTAEEGSAHGISEVNKAAAIMRALDDKWGKEAEAVGLQFKSQKTDPFHIMRIWNVPRINAEEPTFRKVLRDHLQEQTLQRVNELTKRFNAATGRIDEQLRVLQMSPEETAREIAQTQDALRFMRSPSQMPIRFEALDRQIAGLREQRNAAAPGSAARRAVREAIKEIKIKAGQDYADYATARSRLKTYLTRLRGNIASSGDAIERAQQGLVDGEITNNNRLFAMHESLTRIRAKAEREGPEAVAEELAQLRTDFAKTLERSNASIERIGTARAKALQEAARAQELKPKKEISETVPDAGKLNEIEESLAGLEWNFYQGEQRDVARMTRLADEIGELEEFDLDEFIARFDGLVTERLERTGALIERETVRTRAKLERAVGRREALGAMTDAKGKPIKGRVERLQERRSTIARKFNEDVIQGYDVDHNYESYVSEVEKNVFNHITKRFSVIDDDIEIVPTKIGPLKDRVLSIPSSKVRQWLVRDPEFILERTGRQIGAQIEMKRRGWTPSMKDQIDAIRADYERLRNEVFADPKLSEKQKVKRVKKLERRERVGVRDIEAMRDMNLGRYMGEEESTPAAAALRTIGSLNFFRLMGGVLIPSLTDAIRPAMVHGFGPWIRDGLGPLVRNMKTYRKIRKDFEKLGIAAERFSQNTVSLRAGLTDPFMHTSPVENVMRNMTGKFAKGTGILHFTDFEKNMTAFMAIERMRKAFNAKKMSEQDRAWLALLGIDEPTGQQINRAFAKYGFEDDDGLFDPNVGHWNAPEDAFAKRRLTDALNFEVDTTITTPSFGDLPLAARHPLKRPLFQFRAFNFATYQTMLIRGVQEPMARFLGGLISLMTVGMFITFARAAVSGRTEELSDNPGFWIMSGLDNSGMFAVLFDVNNTIEKGLGIGAYSGAMSMFPDKSQEGTPAQFSDQDFVSTLGGPTADFVNSLQQIARHLTPKYDAKSGQWVAGDLKPSTINAIRRLTPGASLPYVRAPLEHLVLPPIRDWAEQGERK